MKTVEQMAREAGFQITPNPVGVPPYYIYGNTYTLLFFAQALMEECAAMCDEIAKQKWDAYKGLDLTSREERGDPYVNGASDGAEQSGDAIRQAAKDLK